MTQGGLARLKALEWRLKYFLCIRQRSCPVELYRLSWPCHGTPLVTSPGDWCLAINLLSHHPPINVLSQSLATCPVWTWPGLLCAAGPAGPPVRPATLQGRKVAGGKMWREERRWSVVGLTSSGTTSHHQPVQPARLCCQAGTGPRLSAQWFTRWSYRS